MRSLFTVFATLRSGSSRAPRLHMAGGVKHTLSGHLENFLSDTAEELSKKLDPALLTVAEAFSAKVSGKRESLISFPGVAGKVAKHYVRGCMAQGLLLSELGGWDILEMIPRKAMCMENRHLSCL